MVTKTTCHTDLSRAMQAQEEIPTGFLEFYITWLLRLETFSAMPEVLPEDVTQACMVQTFQGLQGREQFIGKTKTGEHESCSL